MRGIHQGWEVAVLFAKAEYMSATDPYRVLLSNHLAKGERSIYVATFHWRGVLLCYSPDREVEGGVA